MRNAILAPLVVFVPLACRGAPPTVAMDPPTLPVASAAPSAPPSSGTSAAPDPSADPEAKVCLMVNVCYCNLGCASIGGSRTTLREGMRATALSGALRGKEVKIVRVTDASGASVLSLTDLDHDHACSLSAADKSLFGYGCARAKSGPVPANACAGATACD